MRPTSLACLLLLLAVPAHAGTIHMRPYFGHDRSEVVLVWDEATGASRAWYYDKAEKKFLPSAAEYQLPANPGVSGSVRMAPYLGPDGSEVVLVWDTRTGKSVSWYFDTGEKKFKRAEAGYQLPAQKGAEVHMAPYLAKDKSEVVLVWDAATGKSANWYFDTAEKKFKASEPGFQLPANLGLKGRVMMRPYLAKDGEEVVQTWSVTTGESINWYYDEATKKMARSEAGFQLPANPGVAKDVWMVPYIGNDGTEIILAWSTSTGASVNWYQDTVEKKFKRSDAGFQLPPNPAKAKVTMMTPYLDTDAEEVILIWDAATGASKGFYYSKPDKKMMLAAPGFQLPPNPLK